MSEDKKPIKKETVNTTVTDPKKGKNEEKKVKEDKSPVVTPGMTVRVHETIREKNAKGEEKERIQVFEGIVLAKKHKKEIGATITVRKISSGIGVEKIFPLNSPLITKIEPLKEAAVKRAKLGFLRSYKKKLKETKIS